MVSRYYYNSGSRASLWGLFLLGFIVFSPLSSYITITLLHLPISLPELLFIFFIPFIRRNFKFTNLRFKSFFIAVSLWCLLLLISIWVGKYRIYDLVGTARTYLYIFIFFVLFSGKTNFGLSQIAVVSLGGIIGWLTNASIMFLTLTMLGGKSAVAYGPNLCIPLAFGFYIFTKKAKLAYSILLIAIIIGIIGSLRRVFAVTILTALFTYIYLLFTKPSSWLRMSVFIALVLALFSFIFPILEQSFKSNYFDLYVRVILKTQNLLSGDTNSGDLARLQFADKFISELGDTLLPKGFVSKQTASISDIGYFNDFPLLELSHTFGSFITIAILGYFIFTSFRVISRIRFGFIPQYNFALVLSYLIIIVLLALEGSFLSYPYMALYTGFSLGSLQREAKLTYH